jgi:uncharacterized protein YodC (DUF2158 family)
LANKFKNGDVVVLKSGGPAMTVEHGPGDASYQPDCYFVRWFKGATADQGHYKEHMLQAFEPPKK